MGKKGAEKKYGTMARFWLGFIAGFAVALVVLGFVITLI